MSHLIDSFNSHFELIEADTEELRNEAHRIRYEVYCIEERLPAFEIEKFPDGIECDKYDDRSVQTLIKHRPSGEYIGTARLVLSDPINPSQPFPLEELAGTNLDSSFDPYTELPRARTAEISRLSVKRGFRSSANQSRHPYFTDEHLNRFPEDRRNFLLPLLGGLAAIMRMTAKYSVTHWYAIMEPSLHKRLSRIGFELSPIGPIGDYSGLRRPHLGVVSDVMSHSYFSQQEIWNLITDHGNVWPAPTEIEAVNSDDFSPVDVYARFSEALMPS